MQENHNPQEIHIPHGNVKTPFFKVIKQIIGLILFLSVCIVVAFFLSKLLFATVPIKGPSMEPTLYSEDRVLLYRLGKYKNGDVVIFDSGMKDEEGDPRYLVKRIIAMPGDTVEIKISTSGEYSVFRNDERLVEEYLPQGKPRASDDFIKMVVPEGKFFYLGDNRDHSSDSRSGLLGDIDKIVGRGILKYHGTSFFNELVSIPRVKSCLEGTHYFFLI